MAWSKMKKEESKPPEVNDFFTEISKIEHVGGLKVAIYGKPETGKTYFGLSFPEPIYVLDTEYGAAKVAKVHFPNKRIYIAEVLHIDPDTDQPDPAKSLEKLEKAIAALSNVNEGTIVIDSVTDVWQWITAWLEQVATRRTSTGQPFRFEYGIANERYRQLIMRLLAKPMHVVLTAHEAPVFDSEGREIAGMTQGKWQKQTPHWVDLVIHLEKRFDPKLKKWRHIATIEKCRFKRAFNVEIEDITYDRLKKVLEDELGVRIV